MGGLHKRSTVTHATLQRHTREIS